MKGFMVFSVICGHFALNFSFPMVKAIFGTQKFTSLIGAENEKFVTRKNAFTLVKRFLASKNGLFMRFFSI